MNRCGPLLSMRQRFCRANDNLGSKESELNTEISHVEVHQCIVFINAKWILQNASGSECAMNVEGAKKNPVERRFNNTSGSFLVTLS